MKKKLNRVGSGRPDLKQSKILVLMTASKASSLHGSPIGIYLMVAYE